VVEEEEDGTFSVHCPALKGCHSQGETREEALQKEYPRSDSLVFRSSGIPQMIFQSPERKGRDYLVMEL
jgi:hypothetical protein